jgi:hypothetical protein
MAYVAGSASLVTQYIDNAKPGKLWLLAGTDAVGTVEAANYISDAQALGMVIGDVVFYSRTDTTNLYILVVTNVTSTGSTLGATPLNAH